MPADHVYPQSAPEPSGPGFLVLQAGLRVGQPCGRLAAGRVGSEPGLAHHQPGVMAMDATPDPRRTRAWRKLRDLVVLEEPECRLQLPGCTRISTTADHIEHYKTHPHLALERRNLRGSCETCNKKRGAKQDAQLALGTAPRPRALDIFKPLP